MAKKINIAALRKKWGFTQARMAKELGISQPTLSQFENGARPISATVALLLMQIAKQ